ncbi:MAG TPA: efflux RND transporter periplasmic adaptor subunit [Vicinamibacterales bacterium]|nr:efflux RND transporter periplasmic adaptor subunit [Vicinamibacterales bacterium]
MRRYVIWIVVVVFAGLIVWTALKPTIVEVELGTVVRGPLRVTVDDEGETRLKRRFVVSAPVSGRVLRIESRPGDAVTTGQALAVIEPAAPAPLDVRTRAAAEARVQAAASAAERAQADVQRITVELTQAESDAARARSLLETGSGTREAVEQADARVRGTREAIKSAQAAVRAAEFEQAEARAALISGTEAAGGRAVTVRSPIGGLILRRMQESEAVVPVGAPLLEIGNLDDLEIVTDLLSTDAVRVKPGAPVLIERWGGEGTLNGRVQRVEPGGFMKISALGVEEQRVNVVIDFVDPRERRLSLGDAFRVEVRIVVWEKPDVLLVPTSSLFRTEGEWSAFVAEGDLVHKRLVKIGERNEQMSEVLGGLNAGDKVVTYPGETLKDGSRIAPRK